MLIDNKSLSFKVAEEFAKHSVNELTFAPPFFESFLQQCAKEYNVDVCELYVTTIIRVLYGVFPDSSDHPNFGSFSKLIPKIAQEIANPSTACAFDEDSFFDLEEELHGKDIRSDLEFFEEVMLEIDQKSPKPSKPPRNVSARLCVDFMDLKDYAISKRTIEEKILCFAEVNKNKLENVSITPDLLHHLINEYLSAKPDKIDSEGRKNLSNRFLSACVRHKYPDFQFK